MEQLNGAVALAFASRGCSGRRGPGGSSVPVALRPRGAVGSTFPRGPFKAWPPPGSVAKPANGGARRQRGPRCLPGSVVRRRAGPGAGPAAHGGAAAAAFAAAAAGLRPARGLRRPARRRLVRAEGWAGPVPVRGPVPMPKGASRCRLAGTVPEEERCTVERADASLTYSLFLQRYGRPLPRERVAGRGNGRAEGRRRCPGQDTGSDTGV